MDNTKLSREMLEAVLDPHKDRSDGIQNFQVAIDSWKDSLKNGQRPDLYAAQWQDFWRFVDESPVLRAVIDSVCDYLRASPDAIKEQDKQFLKEYLKNLPEIDEIIEHINPEFWFRSRVMLELEKFFRAGWEARGMVMEAEHLKKMTVSRSNA